MGEDDVCEDEGAEHDGREPDVDGEPGLGWTVDGVLGNSDGMDHEAAAARSPKPIGSAMRHSTATPPSATATEGTSILAAPVRTAA